MAPQIADPADVRAALDPEALLAAAAAEAGSDDFGDRSFVEPLTRWCDAIPDEARLSPMGVQMIKGDIVRMLVNRIRMHVDIQAHPEILEEELADPIIVIGFPRTGTTKLQRMLSAHSGTQKLPMWRLLNPAPFPGTQQGSPDPRIAVAEQNLGLMAQMFPDWVAAHPSAPHEADEEVFLMQMTFEIVTYWQTHVPSFESWCMKRPRHTPYEYLVKQLKYLQWQNPEQRGRPFVMKAVTHCGNLDLVAEYFPGATVVHCHRDPRVALPSTSRLLELLRTMTSEDVDPLEAGREELGFWSTEIARNLAQRETLSDRIQLLDVMYDDIHADPLPVIRTIVDAHGLDLTADDEAAMVTWQEQHPQHQFGRHVYSLERFGLTADEIERSFAAYLERFPALSKESS